MSYADRPLLTVQPRYHEHMLMTIQNLSKCVESPILATCALKDVIPEREGSWAGWCQCLSVCNSNVKKTFFPYCVCLVDGV